MPAQVACVAQDNASLIREYLEWKSSYARPAARQYAIWVRRFQEFANKIPEAFTIADWTRFARDLQGRFAPKCIEYALCIVHNYLRFWHEQGRLPSLPLYLARIPKAIANSHTAVSEEEYLRITAVLRNHGAKRLRDLAIIMLLHDTGMRIGELLNLELEEVEEDCSAIIRTEKTVTRRQVFWNMDTDEVLQRYLVERINSGAESDWLFVTKKGGRENRYTRRSVTRLIKRACEEAGIASELSPHSFRHAFIHRMAALSVPDAIIAQLVGHKTPFTIAQYTKLSRSEFEHYARKQFPQAKLAS